MTFDGTELCGDRFDANLHVLSNDPFNPNLTVPVRLDLDGIPHLAIEPDSLDFGPVRLTEPVTIDLAVINGGCGDAVIE